ncbi:MAG: molybdopterin biosynthesis protein [Nitrospirae bacterium]|nr:molybdopterin biosynthesis protein [Nitrospirota bacterium]
MPKRQIYIEPTPLPDALKLWRDRLSAPGIWAPLPGEVVNVDDSLGRVTADAVAAKLSSPFYHSAAMDGIAVSFADTIGASDTAPRRLKVGDQAVYVDTGDPMPDGMDAVIMIEEIDELDGGDIEIIEPATPWQHVRIIGEDIVATELIVPENHVLAPVDVAALLAGGVTEVKVRRRPKVTLIPTGNELVQPGALLKKGDILEYNSRMLAGMADEWGARTERYGIVPDNMEMLKKYIKDALSDSDLVVVNAGSSAGSEDFTFHAIGELGEAVLHGVNIKPGKPVILGIVDGKPVIGVPGYPVSAFLTFRLFARELIHAWQGREAPGPEHITAKLSRQLASPLGQEEFVRVKLARVGENTIATPVSRGAGVLMSLVRADGIVRIPANSEGMAAGSEVSAELLRPAAGIAHTIACIGSHDNALDLLGNFLKKKHPEYNLSSAHVGSLGGIMALRKGEAHIAGSHLLDEVTGEYNVAYLKKYLADKHPVLVNLVYREQGFLVPRGNPKGIIGFADLKRPDVVFVNRQAGAGTRLLTDLHLKRLGIDPSEVKGYTHEEYTHMSVASAVLSGAADTGLAILASATALGLDFVLVAHERYDLVIPREHYDNPMVQALLEIIRKDKGFKDSVDALGGYDTRDMGKIMWEG